MFEAVHITHARHHNLLQSGSTIQCMVDLGVHMSMCAAYLDGIRQPKRLFGVGVTASGYKLRFSHIFDRCRATLLAYQWPWLQHQRTISMLLCPDQPLQPGQDWKQASMFRLWLFSKMMRK